MCTLEDCCFAARHLLKQGGRLVMVHRAERLMDVLSQMRAFQIEPKKLYFIYSKEGKSARADFPSLLYIKYNFLGSI